MDFIFCKNTQGFVMLLIVSLLALLSEIFTNPQILHKSWSPVVYSLTRWRTQNGCQQRAARQNKTELANFSLNILAVSSWRQLLWFLITSVSNSKVNFKDDKSQRESIILIQASSRQIIPFSMTLILTYSISYASLHNTVWYNNKNNYISIMRHSLHITSKSWKPAPMFNNL